MDRDDAIDLLSIISANDHRTIGQTDIQIWQQALGNVTPDEAVDAVMAHIRDMPGVWLEPGHVVARVKAKRRDAYERSDPDFREADKIEAMFGTSAAVRRDRYSYVDKSEPDDEDGYPADWTTEQRLKAYWAKIQAYRDQAEYEQAVAHPGSLLIKPPASAEARAKAITVFANRNQLAFDDADATDDAVPHVNPLLVGCPYCKSGVGDRCTKAGMPGQPREKLTSIAGHPARIERAARQAGHPESVVAQIVAVATYRQARAQRSQWTDQDQPIVPITTPPAPKPEIPDQSDNTGSQQSPASDAPQEPPDVV